MAVWRSNSFWMRRQSREYSQQQKQQQQQHSRLSFFSRLVLISLFLLHIQLCGTIQSLCSTTSKIFLVLSSVIISCQLQHIFRLGFQVCQEFCHRLNRFNALLLWMRFFCTIVSFTLPVLGMAWLTITYGCLYTIIFVLFFCFSIPIVSKNSFHVDKGKKIKTRHIIYSHKIEMVQRKMLSRQNTMNYHNNKINRQHEGSQWWWQLWLQKQLQNNAKENGCIF